MFTEFAGFTSGTSGLQVVADGAVRGFAVLLVAFGMSHLLRHASAAARHQLWTIAVGALVLLPLISLVLPAWRVVPTLEPAPLSSPAVAAVGETVVPFEVASWIEPAPIVTTAAAPAETVITDAMPGAHASIQPGQLVILAWLAGLCFALLRVGIGVFGASRMARCARPWRSPRILGEIERVGRELGVRPVLALEGSETAMPMTWGIVRAKLLLPSAAVRWSTPRLSAVLRHELAHVQRRDAFWQLIAELACAVHWFNPLAWHAARQLRSLREHACDDEVLSSGARASDYAFELLDIARSLRPARVSSIVAIAMAQPRQLEGRLLAVLDDTRQRARLGRRWPAWLAATVVVIPIATLSPRVPSALASVPILGTEELRDQPPHPTPARRSAKNVEPRQAAAVGAGLVKIPLAIPALQQGRCFNESIHNVSIRSNDDDGHGTHRIKWQTRNCKGVLEMRGRVRLRGDLSGVESISNGGDLRVTMDDGQSNHVLTVKPNGNSLTYDYAVDKKRQPWDANARAWLASVMTFVVRNTGYAADERVDYLLKQGGLSAVLAEVEHMRSDYVERLYLQKLIARTELNGRAVESLLNTATRKIDSDYEMAELLIAVAGKYDFDESIRRAFIQATTTLGSDYEHRRALAAVLKKGGLSADNVNAVLLSSKTISSSYEMAELLLSVVGKYKLDAGMRAAYLASARDLRSDFEKGRVYKALLQQGALSPGEAAEVVKGVGSMSSDHERAEALRLVSADALSDARMQQAYLEVITRMNSDYEVRRSLMQLLANNQLSAEAIDLVLRAALDINSDYERAELLLAVVRAYKLSPEQRNTVIKATDSLKSEYERGRVSSALIRQLNSN